MNVKFLGTCLFTASLLFSGAAAAQGAPDYASIIEQAHQKYKNNHEGKVADYIPALATYSPDNFAITLATVEGKIYQTGDVKSVPDGVPEQSVHPGAGNGATRTAGSVG